MILVTKWFGVFLIDERTGRIADRRLMPEDPDVCAEKLALVQRGGILPEERELVGGRGKVSVSERRQAELGRPEMYDSSRIRAEDFGFTPEMMHEVMIRLGRLRTSEPVTRDKNIVQGIREYDDLLQVANLLDERLHEWYGIYFPELQDLAAGVAYARLVHSYGDREGILAELGIELESMGADLLPEDLDAVRDLAGNLCGIYGSMETTETYIERAVSETAPNLCALLGATLSARLIGLAGGLVRLASLPSSTLQLLGAEKAMFRHLRTGRNPPKHGVIYQYPGLRKAPYWQRGNIARALAGKALIAAKVDAYGGEFCGDRLAEELAARIETVRRNRPEPPKRKPARRPGRKGSPRGRGGPRRRSVFQTPKWAFTFGVNMYHSRMRSRTAAARLIHGLGSAETTE